MAKLELSHNLYLTPTPFGNNTDFSIELYTLLNQLATGLVAEKIKDGKLSEESRNLVGKMFNDEKTAYFFQLAYRELKSADTKNFQVMKNLVECEKLFVGHNAPAGILTVKLANKGKIVNWPLLFQLLKNPEYDFTKSPLRDYFISKAREINAEFNKSKEN